MKDEVWVWLPRDHEGRIAPVAGELLYEARGLCRRLDAGLVLIAGQKPDARANALIKQWGVNDVRVLKAGPAPHPEYDGSASPLAELGSGNPPRVLLMAADSFGSVAAPLWSAESGSELVTSATGVTTDSVHYVVARSTLGDQYESLEYPPLDAPLVVTLLPGAVGGATPPEQAPMKGGGKKPGSPGGDTAYRIHPPDRDTLDIADAERIVAFGRGAFNPEALALVEQLAEKLGAAVAGTRPAADEGWLPFSRQVGLTGAVVRPRLYVAVGISGAPYHMAGVKEPETLIAVNSDAEAPIFGWADMGIVGDLKEVLPRLIMEIGDDGKIKQTGGRAAGRKGG